MPDKCSTIDSPPMIRPAISLMLFDDRDVVSALESADGAGFRAVELLAEAPNWNIGTAQTRQDIQRTLARLGLEASTIHAPFSSPTLDPSSLDEDVRRAAVHTLSESFAQTAELGVSKIIVHPTQSGRHHSLDAKRRVEAARRSFEELISVAERCHVCIAVENLPDMGPDLVRQNRPLASMGELRRFLAELPPDRIGLCLDTGHAALSDFDPAEQARAAGDRLIATHLQDVAVLGRDSHWLPGKGFIHWEHVIQSLAEVEYSAWWTFEVASSGSESDRREVATAATAVARQWSAVANHTCNKSES